MERRMNKSLLTIAMFFCASSAMARFEMIMAGPGAETNSVAIGTNETARIKYARFDGTSPKYRITVKKDGRDLPLDPGRVWRAELDPWHYQLEDTIVGPAEIKIWTYSVATITYFVTLEIIPDSLPPDKTVVVPSGTGFNVQMEMSTDLIFWTPATNGVYNNTNGTHHLFFRIKADVVP
jgi:hypothetical protein